MTIAATAPAVPATMNVTPLHKKSSRQTVTIPRSVDEAIAPATRPVSNTKYVATAPTSGFANAAISKGPVDPPSHA